MGDCISNCSNHGNCTFLNIKKYICKCEKFYSGQSCQVDLRPCSSKPCMNNGTCIQNLTSEIFSCNCGEFYEGVNCEIKKNVCQNETCSKNGNCKDFDNQPKCSCFSLFLGDKCEIESNEKKIVKSVVTTASLIAIIVLTLFCLSCICCDLLSLCGFGKNRLQKY